jgi:hypothetical protein
MIARILLLALASPLSAATQASEAADPAGEERARPPGVSLGELQDLPLLALDGRQTRLGACTDGRVLVLCYTGVGCPISGKYGPRLARLAQGYAARGVAFLGIDASPGDSLQAIERQREELGIGFPVLKDFRQELTRRLGARTTTEVFVFDRAGRLCFRGAVDDQYALGAARPQPTRHYLVQALESVLAGAQPEWTESEAPGCLLTLLPEEQRKAGPTWSHDVAAIVQRRCEACHRPEQVGPFPLQTYEEVKSHAKMIASVVEDKRMPPWNADERFDGVFSNQRSLPAKERATLLEWIAAGMPRGDPAEDPAPAKWPTGWSIDDPDVVFTMERYQGDEDQSLDEALPPEGFAVPREGVVEYQYFTTKTDYPEDRWIQALEVRPGAKDVVHHVLVLIDDPANPSARIDFRTYLAVFVPGDTPSVFPPGYGKRLPAGATLIFQLHYTPNGKERFDRSNLALRFCEQRPDFEVVTSAVFNEEFRIPPGAARHEVRADVVLAEDTGLVALFPHMHTRGADFRYVAHLPDGSEQELLFSHYDFNWQESYLLPDPLPLPPGTRIECIGHFDNSADNPNNPDPSAWVEWGEQTFEEMFIGYFDTVKPVE